MNNDWLALIFPGSGSQYIGMGKQLYDNFAVVRSIYEEASDILHKDFKQLCFYGKSTKLNRVDNLLPALFTTSVAFGTAFLHETGLKPRYMAGHSLGEYSALACGEAFLFSEAVKIVQLRSKLAANVMKQTDSGMTIVNGIHVQRVEELCAKNSTMDEYAAVACYNSTDQTLISGHSSALMKAEECIRQEGGHIIPLVGSAPYHSNLLKDAANQLEEELRKCKIKTPLYPVISNTSLKPFGDKDDIIKHLKRQMYQPIKWSGVMNYISKHSEYIVEAGPGDILTQLVKENDIDKAAFSYNKQREEVLSKVIEIKKYSNLVLLQRCMKCAVVTPNYKEENYNLSLVKNNYKKILDLYEDCETAEDYINISDTAVLYTKKILMEKGVPEAQITNSVHDIISNSI